MPSEEIPPSLPEPQGATHRQSRTPLKADGALPPAVASEEDRQLDYSLRPHSLAEFVGQERIKKVLGMSIAAARQRGEALDHVLFSAPPGLGKTSLAHIIARELGVNLRVTSGPAIERAGDLAAIVSDLKQGDVLFIDEIPSSGTGGRRGRIKLFRMRGAEIHNPKDGKSRMRKKGEFKKDVYECNVKRRVLQAQFYKC